MFHYVSPNLSGTLPFSRQWKHPEGMQSHFHCTIKYLLQSIEHLFNWNTCFRYHSYWVKSWLPKKGRITHWPYHYFSNEKKTVHWKKFSVCVHWHLSPTTLECSAISFWTYFLYYNLWKFMETIKLSEKLRVKATIAINMRIPLSKDI